MMQIFSILGDCAANVDITWYHWPCDIDITKYRFYMAARIHKIVISELAATDPQNQVQACRIDDIGVSARPMVAFSGFLESPGPPPLGDARDSTGTPRQPSKWPAKQVYSSSQVCRLSPWRLPRQYGVSSCPMVVSSCYKNKLLWYLHTVLTYQSHVTPIVTHHRYLQISLQDFHLIIYSGIGIFCQDSLR